MNSFWPAASNLRRLHWLLAARDVEIKLVRLAHESKANFDPDQPRDDHGRWTSGGGTPSEPPPETPEEKPPTAKLRNRVVKQVAKWLAKAAAKETLGPIGTALNLLDAVSWVQEYSPYIQSYLDEPKSLEELRQAVSTPGPGYDIHHIVEQTPAEQEEFPRSRIDAPENLVRIPTLKHWEINAWYQTPNEDFDGRSPREYLRGKSWSERTHVGQDALVRAGILKQ